ncbi:unnamed protein product, partial [marine sediment metagenome]
EAFYVNGKLHGKYTKWWGGGQKWEEGLYVNGMKHGKWTYYDTHGPIQLTTYQSHGTEVTEDEFKEKHPDERKKMAGDTEAAGETLDKAKSE